MRKLFALTIVLMVAAVFGIAPVAIAQTTGISSMELVDANTDQTIRTLTNNSTIDTSVDGTALNVKANPSGTVGSMRAYYDNVLSSQEGAAPYSLCGDTSGNFAACSSFGPAVRAS